MRNFYRIHPLKQYYAVKVSHKIKVRIMPVMRKFALLAERALRGVKTKMKVSGQFASTGTADNYAAIRTYIETCRRNGINEMTALTRLCNGNPYTVEEIFSQPSQQ